MTPGFQSDDFTVSTSDGRNFVLLNSVVFIAKDGTKWTIPAGATSDGASTPRFTWDVLPPFGVYWRAAVLHDAAYRGTLLDAEGGEANLPKDKCDDLLMEAMELCGVSEADRWVIYRGVKDAGGAAFAEDRA